MKKDVLIIHYNTPELTSAAICSLNKTTEGCHVIVFDNSDKKPFVNTFDNVEVIDNTKGQLINFDKWLDTFPNKIDVGNDWASAKHCYSVQWIVNIRKNPFVLMDSDVLVKNDISSFWDMENAYVGQVAPHRSKFNITVSRILPYLCYVNVRMMKQNDVSYFNGDFMWALTDKKPNKAYDTGCWFLENCKKAGLPSRNVDLNDYILHFKRGSWKNKDYTKWLKDNENLWK